MAPGHRSRDRQAHAGLALRIDARLIESAGPRLKVISPLPWMMGATAATAFTAVMAFQMLATLNGATLTGARVPFAAAHDAQLQRRADLLDEEKAKDNPPLRVLQCVWRC